jgi:hypothetical protein
MREPIKFHWKNTHHLYIGIGILIYTFLIMPSVENTILTMYFLLGMYVVIDDIVEHSITATTPLRLFVEQILFPILNQIRKIVLPSTRDLLETNGLIETLLFIEPKSNNTKK